MLTEEKAGEARCGAAWSPCYQQLERPDVVHAFNLSSQEAEVSILYPWELKALLVYTAIFRDSQGLHSETLFQ